SPHHLPCCSLSASSDGWSRLIVDLGAIQRYGCSLCWALRRRPGSRRLLGNFGPATARPNSPLHRTRRRSVAPALKRPAASELGCVRYRSRGGAAPVSGKSVRRTHG